MNERPLCHQCRQTVDTRRAVTLVAYESNRLLCLKCWPRIDRVLAGVWQSQADRRKGI